MDKTTPNSYTQLETPAPEAKAFAARRTVLKGISSVPLVATLASGHSAAAASALNCAVDTPNTEPATITFNELSDDVMVGYPDPEEPTGPASLYFVNSTQVPGDQTLYVRSTPRGEYPAEYVQAIFPVDPDGSGMLVDRPLLASCHTSFVELAMP